MSRAARASQTVLILGVFAVATPSTAQTIFPQPRIDVSPSDTPAPASVVTSSPAVANLFKDTITDFRRLPSLETAAILALGAAVATVGHRADGMATSRMSGSEDLGRFFGAGETIGAARVQLAGALATYTLGRTIGNRRIASVGADLLQANIVTQMMTSAVKMSVRRTRPDGTQYSFPSGHSSTSFATATVLQRHFGWKAGVPAYAVAGYVAASRIQDKRHYLSDVAFGAAIGIVAGRTVTLEAGKRRFTLTPEATLRGAGVSMTWD